MSDEDSKNYALMLRGRGAGIISTFDFSNLSKPPTKKQWNKDAPVWRNAVNGLNLEGSCKKRDCKAYDLQVIIPWGYKNFDWVEEENECKCPICKEYVTPMTCGFTNCYWKYEGKVKEEGKPVEKKSIDWKYIFADGYYTYKDVESLSWVSLLIEVKRP